MKHEQVPQNGPIEQLLQPQTQQDCDTVPQKGTAPHSETGNENDVPQAGAVRPARYEFQPQRGGAKIRVRYREGSASGDCRLCR